MSFDAYLFEVRQHGTVYILSAPCLSLPKNMEESAAMLHVLNNAFGTQNRNMMVVLMATRIAKAKLELRRVGRRKRHVRVYMRARSLHYFRKTWPLLEEERFMELFRFDREAFFLIVRALENRMRTCPPPD